MLDAGLVPPKIFFNLILDTSQFLCFNQIFNVAVVVVFEENL
jgi:hypothetical protein